MDTIKNWIIFLVGIAWAAYQTWQSKAAATAASAAQAKSNTNEQRINGHADMIGDLRKDALPPQVAAALVSRAIDAPVSSGTAPAAPVAANVAVTQE